MDETKYKHPKLILHIPDFYDAGGEHMHKWKDRFSTTVATAATSLIRYLEWPGDKRRDRWVDGQRTPSAPAGELGPFAVYRLDEEATAKLRAEMEAMDPAKRYAPRKDGPAYWVSNKSDREFSAGLRAAIKRALA